ncbi:MAG: hypothetical protein PHZ07_01490 [Patescibacteria group bacterium]|nr:hypothetical protein [Patescibacteria group bacterium]MDD4303891.1 hypothetical protein [Patescibacteria group bacterium]MDD4695122.1 hypothetical protein [Patescibacteria group bacterium]
MENNYYGEQNNQENENQSIDLSDSFDEVVQRRQQNAYIKSSIIDVKKAKKKKIYMAIIIVGWIIIISFALSAWNSSQKRKQQIEKTRQEMQSKIKANANIQKR